jgi:hypothetical protein
MQWLALAPWEFINQSDQRPDCNPFKLFAVNAYSLSWGPAVVSPCNRSRNVSESPSPVHWKDRIWDFYSEDSLNIHTLFKIKRREHGGSPNLCNRKTWSGHWQIIHISLSWQISERIWQQITLTTQMSMVRTRLLQVSTNPKSTGTPMTWFKASQPCIEHGKGILEPPCMWKCNFHSQKKPFNLFSWRETWS